MKFLISILCSIVFILTTACSRTNNLQDTPTENQNPIFGENKDLKEIKIYFTRSTNPEEIFLVPTIRKLSKDDGIISGSLKELFLGPTKEEERKGIMTEIPVGTRLINVEESSDEVLIDISNQFLIGGGSAAMQLRYLQIYKTLKRVAPHKKLFLHVDGKNIKTIGGEGLEITQPLSMINDYTEKHEEAEEDVQP